MRQPFNKTEKGTIFKKCALRNEEKTEVKKKWEKGELKNDWSINFHCWDVSLKDFSQNCFKLSIQQ